MYFKSISVIPILLSGYLADAQAGKNNIKSVCLTLQGSSSVRNVPTSRMTTTETLPFLTITRTVYPLVKATQEPKIITIIKVERATTTTTLRTITGALTTTVTATVTSTSTDVIVTTDISTTEQTITVTSGVVVVPTPIGFRYFSDTAELRPRVKRDEVTRGAVIPLALRGPPKKEGNDGCDLNEKQYPQKVDCKSHHSSLIMSLSMFARVSKPMTDFVPRQIYCQHPLIHYRYRNESFHNLPPTPPHPLYIYHHQNPHKHCLSC